MEEVCRSYENEPEVTQLIAQAVIDLTTVVDVTMSQGTQIQRQDLGGKSDWPETTTSASYSFF